MNIKLVAEVLNEAALNSPILNALIPNEDNYSVLLMQPHGDIQASNAGVKNRNRQLAHLQYDKFLKNAIEAQADLVVTPEYSMPWDTLIAAI